MAGFHGARDIESAIIYVRSGLIGAATAMNLFRGSVQQDAREIVSGVVKKKLGEFECRRIRLFAVSCCSGY